MALLYCLGSGEMPKPPLCLLLAAAAVCGVLYAQTATQVQTESVLEYIKQTWRVLERSNAGLAKAAVDPKFHSERDGRWPVYIPQNGDVRTISDELHDQMSPADFKTIDILPLPHVLELASYARSALSSEALRCTGWTVQ